MGKKKESVPEYASTSYDTGGLFGSSSTNKNGTSYTPASWISTANNTAGTGINTSLNNMLSNDFANDANFQAYQNRFNDLASQNYDTSVLSPLANRGLMRSTGLQVATNNFNDALIDNTTDLMDDYYNRQSNNLASALNTQNALYDYITGLNNSSLNSNNALNNYNLAKYKLENSGSDSNIGSLIGGIGSIANAGADFYSAYKGG